MNDALPEADDQDREIREMMWWGMAEAIIGSGSYALRGDERGQIQVLVHWLRQGAERGYDWQGVYRRIYASWAGSRPLLPSPSDIEALVIQQPPLPSTKPDQVHRSKGDSGDRPEGAVPSRDSAGPSEAVREPGATAEGGDAALPAPLGRPVPREGGHAPVSLSRRYTCPNGHDAGAYAPPCCLQLDGVCHPERGIIVDAHYPFRAQNIWVGGTVGVPEIVKECWEYGRCCMPRCLECHTAFDPVAPWARGHERANTIAATDEGIGACSHALVEPSVRPEDAWVSPSTAAEGIAGSGYPWPSIVLLLYPLAATIYAAAATPAGLTEVVGYGLANLGYVLFAAGTLAGRFRILGLKTRWQVFGAALVSYLVGTVLVNIGG